jgi:hypothetical protein
MRPSGGNWRYIAIAQVTGNGRDSGQPLLITCDNEPGSSFHLSSSQMDRLARRCCPWHFVGDVELSGLKTLPRSWRNIAIALMDAGQVF